MAGSLNHIINNDGKFTMDTIENLGDAYEALEECYFIIYKLTGGNKEIIDRVLEELNYPTIKCDMIGY